MDKCDAVIIGSGVVGLSIAAALPGKNVVVIDKNDSFGRETSSRNSEVIHAGLYYQPGSLKARLCIEGRDLLYAFCRENKIPHQKIGKLLIAVNEAEEQKVKAIYDNARLSGVTGLEFFTAAQVRAVEPGINATMALWCPDTGIVDSHRLMEALYHKAKSNGAIFSFYTEAAAIQKNGDGYTVTVGEPGGESFGLKTAKVINCGGLHADKVAAMTGLAIDKLGYKIHYCRGQYFRASNPKKFSVRHLIYPPATPVSLGIHLTNDLAGGLRLGPDEKYISDLDYQIDNNDLEKFYLAVKEFLPSLEKTDLIPDTVGIRPKLQGPGEDFRDFIINEESANGLPGFVNLLGIESPGLTAALAIAKKVASELR